MAILDKILESEAKRKEDVVVYKKGYEDGKRDGFEEGYENGFQAAKTQYKSKKFYDPLGEEER